METHKGIYKLEVYRLSLQLAETIWTLIHTWEDFPKDAIGKYLLKEVDDIAINIARGYTRHSPNVKRNFIADATSAATATRAWLDKLKQRNLISEKLYTTTAEEARILINKLSGFVRFLEQEGGADKEEEE